MGYYRLAATCAPCPSKAYTLIIIYGLVMGEYLPGCGRVCSPPPYFSKACTLAVARSLASHCLTVSPRLLVIACHHDVCLQ